MDRNYKGIMNTGTTTWAILLVTLLSAGLAFSQILPPPKVEVKVVSPKKMDVGEKYVIKVKTNLNAHKVFIQINGNDPVEMKGSKKAWTYTYRIKKSSTVRYKIYGVNKKGNKGKADSGQFKIKLTQLDCGEAIGKNDQGFKESRSPKDDSITVRIPAGTFSMGSDAYSDEGPVHTVFLSEYCIDKYLVTNKQFEKFVSETGYKSDAEKEGYGRVRVAGRWKKISGAYWKMPDGIIPIDGKGNHPVVQVSHNDALKYCSWAGKRLPAEAEWEKAARGTKKRKFPWGNEEPDDTLTNFDNLIGSTTPVDKYEKGQSIYGLYDMAGNVYQWVNDWYRRDYYRASPDKNPKGPKNGNERVVRGGSFIESSDSLRSTNRDRYESVYSSYLFGFRCAY